MRLIITTMSVFIGPEESLQCDLQAEPLTHLKEFHGFY